MGVLDQDWVVAWEGLVRPLNAISMRALEHASVEKVLPSAADRRTGV
jgi:hypothetical protein